jgi:tetratricopeptide (TPR) repeat protein
VPQNSRQPLLPVLIVFVLLCAGFGAAAFAIPALISRFARVLPDNYYQSAARLIHEDRFAEAQQVAQKRIRQFTYDFTAHYVLAEALARQKKFKEAADVMKLVLKKVPAAIHNKVTAIGYDEPRTFALLSLFLWNAGNYFEAGEMARASFDEGASDVDISGAEAPMARLTNAEAGYAAARLALKTGNAPLHSQALQTLLKNNHEFDSLLEQARWRARYNHQTTAVAELLSSTLALPGVTPRALLEAKCEFQRDRMEDQATSASAKLQQLKTVRHISPDSFQLPAGAAVQSDSLLIGRVGTAEAKVNTGVFRVTNLMFSISGTPALSLYPIMIIRDGDKELTRVYADAPRGRVYDLPLWPGGAPKNLDLAFEFTNDAYDPFTRADRNVLISNITLY